MSKNVCAVCSVEAPFKCNACKIISYCGAEHQKKHWKIHKLECRPFEIGHSPKIKRFLRATRDIPAETQIFTELPLIYGPKPTISEEESANGLLPCVGCFKLCHIGASFCPKCFWPACSSTCSGLTDANLHGMECSILCLKQGPPYNVDQTVLLDFYRTDVLLVLKCLLLQKTYPKKWQELMQLESHDDVRKGTDEYNEADTRIVSYLQTNFIETIRMAERQTGNIFLEKSDSQILHKICGVIEVNFMLFTLRNGAEVSGVFPTGCILEHSCVPNCFYTFYMSKGYRICVKTGKDIKKGENLKIMYTHILWGTQMRQGHLKATKYFSCECERCIDPTELGTYLSALKCIGTDLATCGGYQIAINPIDEQTEWVCNKCPVRLSNEHNLFLMSKMSDEVENATVTKQSDIKELESLIDKFSHFLHKNHYQLFALKHSLIQLYGTQTGYHPDQMSELILKKKIELCEELLQIVEKLDPSSIRLSIYTSIILYELHASIVELELRKTDENIIQENLHRSKKLIEKAKEIIQTEFDTASGIRISEKIYKGYENLREVFNQRNIAFE